MPTHTLGFPYKIYPQCVRKRLRLACCQALIQWHATVQLIFLILTKKWIPRPLVSQIDCRSYTEATVRWERLLTADLLSHWALRWRHNGCDSVSNHLPHHCLLNRLFRRRSKKTSKLRVTGLCAGNSPGTGEFSAQMASNAEIVSIWWRHHGGRFVFCTRLLPLGTLFGTLFVVGLLSVPRLYVWYPRKITIVGDFTLWRDAGLRNLVSSKITIVGDFTL